jgi:hypothetical protein
VQSGAKTVITSVITLLKCFITYFHAFLITSNLIKHLTINDMVFMTLLMVSNFIKVQGSKRDYLTKDGYFSKQEGFIMIYLL